MSAVENVEELETVGATYLGYFYSKANRAVWPAKAHELVDRAKAEYIIAAKVEQERLRFEGELDKWMKTIGAGITGYQPEAYALMDLACQELVNLRADNAALTAKLETANALVTCCCGNPVDNHGIGDGHSPVDQYHYAMMQLEEQNKALTKKNQELESAWLKAEALLSEAGK